MRHTLARAAKLLPKKNIPVPASQIKHIDRQDQYINRPSLIDILAKRKEEAGDSWPTNLRIEPTLYSRHYKNVKPELRQRLKTLVKET